MATPDEAAEAILAAIVRIANSASQYSGGVAARMLRDAAVAYRAVVGGEIPVDGRYYEDSANG